MRGIKIRKLAVGRLYLLPTGYINSDFDFRYRFIAVYPVCSIRPAVALIPLFPSTDLGRRYEIKEEDWKFSGGFAQCIYQIALPFLSLFHQNKNGRTSFAISFRLISLHTSNKCSFNCFGVEIPALTSRYL